MSIQPLAIPEHGSSALALPGVHRGRKQKQNGRHEKKKVQRSQDRLTCMQERQQNVPVLACSVHMCNSVVVEAVVYSTAKK